jgi:hypothetical protein
MGRRVTVSKRAGAEALLGLLPQLALQDGFVLAGMAFALMSNLTE